MTWNRDKGPGTWCPENDGAYRAEQAAIYGSSRLDARKETDELIEKEQKPK